MICFFCREVWKQNPIQKAAPSRQQQRNGNVVNREGQQGTRVKF